jgi:hypothetical protein
VVFRPGKVLARFHLPAGFKPSFIDQVRLLWSTTMGMLDRRLPALRRLALIWRRKLPEMLFFSQSRRESE